jgi:hypothetical protein
MYNWDLPSQRSPPLDMPFHDGGGMYDKIRPLYMRGLMSNENLRALFFKLRKNIAPFRIAALHRMPD